MAEPNVFDDFNRQIWDFVHEPRNRRLLAATGSYSTLFRGRLFGESRSAQVAAQMATRRVDVLWLGSNPCMPRSLEHIVNPPEGSGDLPDFERQIRSGVFGSCKWDGDTPAPDFNPIEWPRGGWTVYRDALAGAVDLDAVTMANFLPWGSQTFDSFLTSVAHTDRNLLSRILDFADQLHALVVRRTQPRLAVIPLSLARNRRVDNVRPLAFSVRGRGQAQTHAVKTDDGLFSVLTDTTGPTPLVYLRHPASLRLSAASKLRIVDGLATLLACTLQPRPPAADRA